MECNSKYRKRKSVIIYTSINLVSGNSAGRSRIINISNSFISENIDVYIPNDDIKGFFNYKIINKVYPGIYIVGKIDGKFIDRLFSLKLIGLYLFSRKLKGDHIFYFYPSSKWWIDLYFLFIIKFILKQKIFIDINELRVTYIQNRIISKNSKLKLFSYLRNLFDIIGLDFVEYFTKFFDGAIIISTNLLKYFSNVNIKKILVPILCGSENFVTIKKSFKINKNCEFKIGFFGQINRKKEGFDILYNSLSLLKNDNIKFKLYLYGPIDDEEEILKILPRKFGIEGQIKYGGIVQHDKIFQEYQLFHLLILPRTLNSQTKYGFSTKLSEYMVSGTPVLATDVSDNSKYLKDGVNGYIVEPGNVNEMYRKLKLIIQEYNSKSELISREAKNTALEYFHFLNYSKNLSNFVFEGI